MKYVFENSLTSVSIFSYHVLEINIRDPATKKKPKKKHKRPEKKHKLRHQSDLSALNDNTSTTGVTPDRARRNLRAPQSLFGEPKGILAEGAGFQEA